MKISHRFAELFLLAGLLGGAAQAQTPAAAPAPAQPAPAAAEDNSRWRYLAGTATSGLLIAERPQGDQVRSISTYVVFAQPNNGMEGLLTRFEVNCETEVIKDLGGTGYVGNQPHGDIASQTGGQFIRIERGTLFEAIAAFTCNGETPSGDRRILRGRTAAIAYARNRMLRR